MKNNEYEYIVTQSSFIKLKYFPFSVLYIIHLTPNSYNISCFVYLEKNAPFMKRVLKTLQKLNGLRPFIRSIHNVIHTIEHFDSHK